MALYEKVKFNFLKLGLKLSFYCIVFQKGWLQ